MQLRGDHDLFDSAKKLKSSSAASVSAKLSTAQRRAINTNHFLVLLKMNKVSSKYFLFCFSSSLLFSNLSEPTFVNFFP